MTSSHSFHALEAEQESISFIFGHTHMGMIETNSPPPLGQAYLLLNPMRVELFSKQLPLALYSKTLK